MMTRTAIHPLKIVAGVGAALLVWGVVLAYASSPAHAATITVNSTDDVVGNDGLCTLREAITSANNDPTSVSAPGECENGSGDDVIHIETTGTVNLTGALPNLSSNLDMEGPGADEFTVRRDSGGDYRILTVTGNTYQVSISGITVSNGNLRFGSGGGGIQNLQDGTLAISGSTISGNSGPNAGGIDNRSNGTLTVTDSTISGNTAKAGTIERSPGGQGAGIHNGGDGSNGPTLTVTDSTISGNTAGANAASGGQGGGIWSANYIPASRTTTIRNSTISGNTAEAGTEFSAYGGGVYNPSGRLVVEFSTITGNTAPDGTGSGVASFGDDLTSTEVLSSIISANQGTDVDFVNGTKNSFSSDGYNLIGDGNATGAFDQTGDKPDPDPKLDPLDSYGGPTQTHRLQADSPAMDAIPQGTNGCGTTFTQDQRGVARPRDGDANGMTGCDIGAYEEKPPELSIDDVSVTEGDSGTTEAVITVSLSRPSPQPVTVGFAPADDTATIAGNDYIPFAGTINFAPSQTTRSDVVAALVKGDTTHEEDETFFVNLINPTGAEISDAQGTVTIRNDDPLPDTTPPDLSVSHTGANADDWNNTSAVTLDVSASDSGSGLSGSPTCTDGDTALTLTAGSTAGTWTASVSGEGTHAISCSVTDNAGIRKSATDTVNIDTKAPTISDLGPTTSANGNGWYNTDVTNRFRATDSLSGVNVSGLNAACVAAFPADQAGENVQSKTTGGEGSSVKVTSDGCTDVAGNTAKGIDSATFQIDTTAPTIIVASAKKADGGDYKAGTWSNQSVTVSYTCSDGTGSGVASCPAEQTFSDDGADQSASGTATDNAGNTASVTFGDIDIDRTKPRVTCDVASPGPTFVLGGAGGNVGVTVADETSGPLATSLSSAATVSSVGNKSVSLTGSDNAGNTTTLSCPYTVKYSFLGPFSPIPLSSYKAGSTIPLKFALANAAGSRISDAAARALVASPCKVKVSLDAGTKSCAAYNATTDTFQYNVKVPKNLSSGTYTIVVEISAPDGSGVVNKESVEVNIRR